MHAVLGVDDIHMDGGLRSRRQQHRSEPETRVVQRATERRGAVSPQSGFGCRTRIWRWWAHASWRFRAGPGVRQGRGGGWRPRRPGPEAPEVRRKELRRARPSRQRHRRSDHRSPSTRHRRPVGERPRSVRRSRCRGRRETDPGSRRQQRAHLPCRAALRPRPGRRREYG